MAIPDAAAHARGLGAAVRDQPPRPLRARARPARRARRRRRRAHRLRQLRGHLRSPVVFDDLGLPHAARTTRGWPTGSPRPPTCCSPSARRGAGRPTASSPTPLHPGRDHRDQPAAPHGRRHAGAALREPRPRTTGQARRRSRAPRPASLLATWPRPGGHRRPLLRGLQRGRGRRPVAPQSADRTAWPPYALDPDNAERLWELSLELLAAR